MHPKLKKMIAKLADLMEPDPSDRDQKAVATCMDDIAKFAESDEAKGYTGSEDLTAFAATIKQLRGDLDAQADQIRKLEGAGLHVGKRQVKLAGYDEIMSMRKVMRVFPLKETAEQFGAIAARMLFAGDRRYKEIVAPRTRDMAEELIKALDPGVSGSGAELVANVYMADMIAHVEAVGVLFNLCDRVMLATTGQTIYPKLTGEMTAVPVAVAAQIAETSPTFGTVTLTPVKWGTLTPVPNEFFRNPTLLDQLGQRLAWLITRAIAYAFDNALVNGDGTSAYGTITGLLNDSSLTTVTASAAQSVGAYTGAQIGDIIAGLAKDYVTDPRWYMSLSSEPTIRNIRPTTGTPLYERGGNGEPNTIDNFPYSICQRFPAASVGADAEWAAFGDLRLSHYFGMLGGIQLAQSEHVRFESDVTVIRGLAHADAATKDADAIVLAKTKA